MGTGLMVGAPAAVREWAAIPSSSSMSDRGFSGYTSSMFISSSRDQQPLSKAKFPALAWTISSAETNAALLMKCRDSIDIRL